MGKGGLVLSEAVVGSEETVAGSDGIVMVGKGIVRALW